MGIQGGMLGGIQVPGHNINLAPSPTEFLELVGIKHRSWSLQRSAALEQGTSPQKQSVSHNQGFLPPAPPPKKPRDREVRLLLHAWLQPRTLLPPNCPEVPSQGHSDCILHPLCSLLKAHWLLNSALRVIITPSHPTVETMCFFFFLFRATYGAYGSSQARGWITAAAAGLHHSNSNTRSEPCLQPTPGITATSDP